MADDVKESPLAYAFLEAIDKQFPGDGAPLGEVLDAAAIIAAAYLRQIDTPEERSERLDVLVSALRHTVFPDGDRTMCMGCTMVEAFNRKYPEGMTKTSQKEMLDVLSRMSAQFLDGASEKGLEKYFGLIRSHRDAHQSEQATAAMGSHLTH